MTEPSKLQIADIHRNCTVLGPGDRYAIWVQGCPLRCQECISPQWIPFSGGRQLDVESLALDITGHAVDGLTISGGEPFAQAAALLHLVKEVRSRRDLPVMCYSGYTLARLRAGDAAQKGLLDEIDILVDGPYLPRHHAALRWRGSTNQKVNILRAREGVQAVDLTEDVTVGLQFEITREGALHWMGVPHQRAFRDSFETALELVEHPDAMKNIEIGRCDE